MEVKVKNPLLLELLMVTVFCSSKGNPKTAIYNVCLEFPSLLLQKNRVRFRDGKRIIIFKNLW